MTKSKKSANTKAATHVQTYALSAAAKKIDAKSIKPATHRGACLLALKKLGSAPFAAILAEVEKQKTIETGMDLAKAVRWMVFDMVRRGLVVAK